MKLTQILILMILLLPCVGLAEESGQKVSDLKVEVVLMRQSINELVQLLQQQHQKNAEFQELQIAVTYLSFRSRSIEMKQYELRFKKERRDGIESAIARIEANPERWDKLDKSLQTKSLIMTSSDAKPSEVRIKMLQDRLEDAETEIIALETEIQNAQDELASFESYVQERLMLFQ
jgi:hypothetical protein